jgi:hypothetical protein
MDAERIEGPISNVCPDAEHQAGELAPAIFPKSIRSAVSNSRLSKSRTMRTTRAWGRLFQPDRVSGTLTLPSTVVEARDTEMDQRFGNTEVICSGCSAEPTGFGAI